MSETSDEQRRLAAIMFTDMVGYSALTQRNETVALELLHEHRQLLRGLFPKFDGREVETTGDGFLVEFGSALKAAKCAIEIQRAVAARNLAVPADRQVQVRIGIHVGDVIHKDGQVLGDGVNIAARLQPLAEPGGICISVDVARQVQNSLQATVAKMGEAELKNIRLPMEIFRIVLPWEKNEQIGVAAHGKDGSAVEGSGLKSKIVFAVGVLVFLNLLVGLLFMNQRPVRKEATAETGPVKPAAVPEKSVAVLPFANMSGDKENEYLSDGITEEVLNALAQVPELRVPARTSSFVFKGKSEDVRKIGELLRVGTVLEGSVRQAGHALRVTAQLINVADGFHLWSETFDRDLTNIFAIEEEIARAIAMRLQVTLLAGSTPVTRKPQSGSVESYQLLLRGLYYLANGSESGINRAVTCFKEALRLEPDYGAAHVGLAQAYDALAFFGYIPRKQANPLISAAVARALELDSSSAEAHAALAGIFYANWDWAQAGREYEKALKLNPMSSAVQSSYAEFLNSQGRFEEALRQTARVREIDPLNTDALFEEAWIRLKTREYLRSIEIARGLIAREPDSWLFHEILGLALFRSGARVEGIGEMETSARLDPGARSLARLGRMYGQVGRKTDGARVLEQLLERRKSRYVPAHLIAFVYEGLGRFEEANTWMLQAIAERESLLTMLKTEADELNAANPFFPDWLKRIGFPP